MDGFVWPCWTQRWPFHGPIFPANENPKLNPKTLAMVKSSTSHENAIKYYRKLANMMVIKNIQLFYAISTRIMLFDFKKRDMSWVTYSAIWGLETLALDCFCLLGIPGNDWNRPRVLNWSLSRNSIHHFFLFFQVFVLVHTPPSSLVLSLHCFYMYWGVN